MSGFSCGLSSAFSAGKNLDVNSLFFGLIDDARIYNVALSAEEVEALAY
jgi:hypothetical protein